MKKTTLLFLKLSVKTKKYQVNILQTHCLFLTGCNDTIIKKDQSRKQKNANYFMHITDFFPFLGEHDFFKVKTGIAPKTRCFQFPHFCDLHNARFLTAVPKNLHNFFLYYSHYYA